jgi:hypothetical protein
MWQLSLPKYHDVNPPLTHRRYGGAGPAVWLPGAACRDSELLAIETSRFGRTPSPDRIATAGAMVAYVSEAARGRSRSKYQSNMADQERGEGVSSARGTAC